MYFLYFLMEHLRVLTYNQQHGQCREAEVSASVIQNKTALDAADGRALAGREGFTAQAVFDQLRPEELMQSGIVLPVAGAAAAEEPTGVLLAQWLSTAYITLAQACFALPRWM